LGFWSLPTSEYPEIANRAEQLLQLYSDQRNAQVFDLFVDLLLPYMFRAFF
jgi:hypothetical protein